MAARKYLGKPAVELSVDEAALLVGLIRAPSRFSPVSSPIRAVERRNAVLDQMVHQGSLPRADAERAKAAPLTLRQ
jgi:membrane peptidoglycan carboxypeptidase